MQCLTRHYDETRDGFIRMRYFFVMYVTRYSGAQHSTGSMD